MHFSLSLWSLVFLLEVAFSFPMSCAAVAIPQKLDLSSPKPVHARAADILVGIYARNTGDIDRSAAAFAAAHQDDPNDKFLLQQVYGLYLLTGDRAVFSLVDKVSPDETVDIIKAKRAIIAHNWVVARRHYEKIDKGNLLILIKPILIAWTLQAEGNTDSALAVLEPYLPSSQLAPLYAYNAALIAHQAGRKRDAVHYFTLLRDTDPFVDLKVAMVYSAWLNFRGEKKKAIELLNDIEAVFPITSVAREQLQQFMKRPLEITPENAMTDAFDMLVLLTEKSGFRQHSNNLPVDERHEQIEWLSFLQRLYLSYSLLLMPNKTEAILLLSNLTKNDVRKQFTIHRLENVPKSDPLYNISLVELADNYSIFGDKYKAGVILEKLLSYSPNNPLALRLNADFFLSENQFKKAIALYNKALNIQIGKISTMDWTILLQRATAYGKIGQWDNAEKDAQTALSINSDSPFLLNFLGYSWLLRKKNIVKAYTMLLKADADMPGDPAIQDSLGWASILLDKIDAGVRVLELASEKVPNDPELNYHLAVGYALQKRKVEAIYMLDLAARDNTDIKMQHLIDDIRHKIVANEPITP